MINVMQFLPYFAFAMAVAYATIGNAVVYVALKRRRIPVGFAWAGTPFYLYRICTNNVDSVGDTLRLFSLSTNLAFLAGVLLAIPLLMVHNP